MATACSWKLKPLGLSLLRAGDLTRDLVACIQVPRGAGVSFSPGCSRRLERRLLYQLQDEAVNRHSRSRGRGVSDKSLSKLQPLRICLPLESGGGWLSGELKSMEKLLLIPGARRKNPAFQSASSLGKDCRGQGHSSINNQAIPHCFPWTLQCCHLLPLARGEGSCEEGPEPGVQTPPLPSSSTSLSSLEGNEDNARVGWKQRPSPVPCTPGCVRPDPGRGSFPVYYLYKKD